ncbi:MAG: type I-C CRISPR-associated protein Cas8c/Csd1 [Magnetospirillum sp.]|nr:type I-C CRISPR-associated protein Cas8c/Csd1 [Magnetospirillum sp.]
MNAAVGSPPSAFRRRASPSPSCSLRTEGLNSCRDLRDHTGRQPVGRPVTVPRTSKRSGTTPRAFFLWDNSKFVLGLGNGTGQPGITTYSAHAAAFRETHERLLDDATDPGLLAVLRFLRTWTPSRFDGTGLRRLSWTETSSFSSTETWTLTVKTGSCTIVRRLAPCGNGR